MFSKPFHDKKMIEYLLGDLSPEEKNHLEERYFSDDEVFEHLKAIEDELLDEYARDELSVTMKGKFEKHLLTKPLIRKKLDFTRNLLDHMPRTEHGKKEISTPKTMGPIWSVMQCVLPPRPVYRAAMWIVFIAACSSLVWVVRINSSLRKNLSMKEKEASVLEKELNDERDARDELALAFKDMQASRTIVASFELNEDFFLRGYGLGARTLTSPEVPSGNLYAASFDKFTFESRPNQISTPLGDVIRRHASA